MAAQTHPASEPMSEPSSPEARGRSPTADFQANGTAGGDGADVQELRRQLAAKQRELEDLQRRIDAAEHTSMGAHVKAAKRPLSIVVPMGGLGDAFAEAGFRFPRPLVNVVGRPVLLWLLDHLTVHPQDLVIFVVPAVMDRQYGIGKMLQSEFPSHTFRICSLPFETRGWVETVLAAVRQMSEKELRNRLVTLDCSTVYHGFDLLARCRSLKEGEGASVYFDTQKCESLSESGAVASQFSYIQLDETGYISEVKEKSVISSLANTGAYIFSSGRCFRQGAEAVLESPEDASKGGLYASVLMSSLLSRSETFRGLEVDGDHIAILATPTQLEAFIRRVSSGAVPMQRKMRFCFDLDGTLVTQPRVPSNSRTCEPIPRAISLVRQLHRAKHTIIITTSRGMEGGPGASSAVAKVGHATFTMLEEFGIPYDELHFGKPQADVYIDSRSLNAQADIERDLGWSVGSKSAAGGSAIDGAIDARSFNLVRAKGKEHVIKSSRPEILRGECHWYKSIPEELADLFPKTLPEGIVEGCTTSGKESLSTITMTKVRGVTFAHLTTMRLLMKASLRQLVNALHRIHTQQPPEGSPAAAEARAENADLCCNYASKVSARAKKHADLYASLGKEAGVDTQKMCSSILGFLEEFEASERAQHACYIHGDPVFSNVIRTDEDRIVLIDMRGELGGRCTTQGDVHYDLSKVYQSLCGYDFMLLDQVPDGATSVVADELRAAFWEEVSRLYPSVHHRDVRLHTASHFFTIVPLHEVQIRQVRYLRTSRSMLDVEGLL